jgi:hypothetical protein
MKNNHRTNGGFPVGWDEKRVRAVIEHYDRQTEEERTAEIEKAAVADAWHKFADAIKDFNRSNLSKIRLQRERGLLTWRGSDEDGPFAQDYTVDIAVQLPALDQPIRPVLGVIFRKLKPAVPFPGSRKKQSDILAACADGVKLEVVKKKTGLAMAGVSTSVYPKHLDGACLCDALIRLEHSIHRIRASCRVHRSAT